MIGRNEDSPLGIALQGREQWTDDVPIDLLQGLDLGIRAALVRGLVRGLDVDADHVVVLQGLDGVPPFGGVVRIEIAGGPGHVDPRQPISLASPRKRSTAVIIAPPTP